jgi:hypothetical protein
MTCRCGGTSIASKNYFVHDEKEFEMKIRHHILGLAGVLRKGVITQVAGRFS